MSIRAIDWALRQKVGSHLRKLVLVKLADNANDDGECFPSQDHIAAAVEASRESVNRQIKQLVEAGFIQSFPRYRNGMRRGNNYRLCMGQEAPSEPQLEDGHDVTQDHSGCDAGITAGVTQDHTVRDAGSQRNRQRTVSNNHSSATQARGGKKPRSQLPSDWQPSDQAKQFALERGFSKSDIEEQRQEFIDHHQAKGSVFANYDAAWRTWVKNAIRWGKVEPKDGTADKPFPGYVPLGVGG